jgi:isopentenyl diphosphate isomerase/L-lactate dehydrogenase-like FMN-dependent dehydrogenase
VFVGRATLYGAAAGGMAWATRALDIFRDEIGRTMMQMGAPDIRSLGPQFLTWDSDDLRRNAPPMLRRAQ